LIKNKNVIFEIIHEIKRILTNEKINLTEFKQLIKKSTLVIKIFLTNKFFVFSSNYKSTFYLFSYLENLEGFNIDNVIKNFNNIDNKLIEYLRINLQVIFNYNFNNKKIEGEYI